MTQKAEWDSLELNRTRQKITFTDVIERHATFPPVRNLSH
jgi:hypothetical protein